MFPKLSIILTAVIAACVAVLAASIGLVGTGNPVKHAADVPDVSRPLMQQAVIEVPEWQNFQLLAYTRRADELLRLRDLPAAPARAVVEFAEQAQADAAVAQDAPPFATEPAEDATSTRTTMTTATVIAALQADQAEGAGAAGPAPVGETVAADPAAGGDTPIAGPAAGGDTQAASVAASVVASIATSVKDDADQTASLATAPKPAVVAKPRSSPKVAAPAPRKRLHAAPASRLRRVARVQDGVGATANAPEKPSASAHPRAPTIGAPTVAARTPRKRFHAIRAPRQVAPSASTGFPVDVQAPNGQDPMANAGLSESVQSRR